MGNSFVKSQLSLTKNHLHSVSNRVRDYLNKTTLDDLKVDDESVLEDELSDILVQLRRLNVFIDEGYESCQLVLKSGTFRKGAAEKTLYWIYYRCIEEFFQPRLDTWYEDSRAAYTGKNAIKFYISVPDHLKQLVKDVESPLQELREELEYYETDFRTKMLHSK
ncbi:DUF3907 family protein [Texcoconibacillus texcoconensis]|uniref:DUF3907 family protein n=1 Tax=Texcoconibacillus texcoconensis TaxID=1095777 RepID=A0A840QNK5_9BACI|nr:DUF3907 family protein [Texcoconibacillus texcoconensis]MBB5172966.1 hypothetical protein [Texcoconibacillus texcoconensis]